ncbi:MAG: GerW family sporulation protein, partial [Cyanobacteria bacterium P01_E01_bin.34]
QEADVESQRTADSPEAMTPLGTWGGAGGGVKVEPMGFLVIRGESVEMLPIERNSTQWAAIAEGVMPMLEQWLEERSRVPSELE